MEVGPVRPSSAVHAVTSARHAAVVTATTVGRRVGTALLPECATVRAAAVDGRSRATPGLGTAHERPRGDGRAASRVCDEPDESDEADDHGADRPSRPRPRAATVVHDRSPRGAQER
ncbi:hypothetical protein CBZ_35580 [Cellulomonas biazotea]|uniref:Uncharacterized protein n=1 Tax=Cellulomonas biazotea TaxID=1709 RepID=A0A402DWP0_9CELL|nr:hypothetical protein CBZ_35580 [Cellulomonas biazotea]